MSAVLQKRLDLFQQKVQQRIEVADAEIEKLQEYYNNIQAECTELSDLITRFEIQHQQHVDMKIGEQKKRQLMNKSKLAQLIAQQQEEIRVYQKKFADEVQQLQQDFDKSMKIIQEKRNRSEKELLQQYDPQIEILETQLEQKKNESIRIASFTAEELESRETNAQLENQIAFLENMYQEKMTERQNQLVMARDKLAECVGSIEQLELDHRRNINELRRKLKEDEDEYNNKVERYKEHYRSTMSELRRMLHEKEKKTKKIQRDIQKVKLEHDSEMRYAFSECDRIRADYDSMGKRYAHTRDFQMQSFEKSLEDKENEKYQQLKRTLADAERELEKERAINSELKKSLVNLKFERRTAKRRKFFNI